MLLCIACRSMLVVYRRHDPTVFLRSTKEVNVDEQYHSLLYTYQFSPLDTVNCTECDLIFQITTLWVSDSISPLSETDHFPMGYQLSHLSGEF